MPSDVLSDTRVIDAPEATTKTTMTLTIEVDGFVGLRQAQAAAENAARQLRNVLPYDARVADASTNFVDASGDSYDDIANASELPQPEAQAPLAAAAAPEPYPPRAPVAPLGVEAQRGGLPDGSLAVNEITEPTPGIGAVVTSSPQDIMPTPYDPGPGGPGVAESERDAAKAAEGEEEVPPYSEWTLTDLRAEASAREIEGRSAMSKDELVAALEDSDAS